MRKKGAKSANLYATLRVLRCSGGNVAEVGQGTSPGFRFPVFGPKLPASLRRLSG